MQGVLIPQKKSRYVGCQYHRLAERMLKKELCTVQKLYNIGALPWTT